MRIPVSDLERLIAATFASAGSTPDEAACLADHLVKANLAGHDSHGVIRTPIYIRWVEEEKVLPNRKLETVLETDSLLVADGQMGFGQWVGRQAVLKGIEKCRGQGLSLVALRNCGHLGRIGHYAEMAAEERLVSLHFVNTSGLGMLVVPAGGLDKRLSVNPVCIGVPQSGGDHLVLDIAAAATAEGKLKVARNQGVPVPEGWIVDAEGNPTTDPNDFYAEPRGAILPMGGHKGYGLGLMADLLAGALTGSGCSSPGKTLLEQGMLSVFIDPARLQPEDAFFGEVARYVDFVRSSRPIDPDKPVLAPSDIERARCDERTRLGVELDETTWQQLVDTASALNVDSSLYQR